MPRFGQCQDCEHWALHEGHYGYGVCKQVDSYSDDDLKYERPMAFITMCVDGGEETPNNLLTNSSWGCASFSPAPVKEDEPQHEPRNDRRSG